MPEMANKQDRMKLIILKPSSKQNKWFSFSLFVLYAFL